MLVVASKEDERVYLLFDQITDDDLAKLRAGEPIVVTVTDIRAGYDERKVRTGYDAPKSVRIYRESLYQNVLRERHEAAVTAGKE